MKKNKHILVYITSYIVASIIFIGLVYYVVYKPEKEYLEMASLINDIKEGDIITIGKYEQDNNLDNGLEDIEWYVIDRSNHTQAILVSKNILDYKPYNPSVMWKDSDLRNWLNNDFYNNSFSNLEKKYISSYHLYDFYDDTVVDDAITIINTSVLSTSLSLSDIDINNKEISIYNSYNTDYADNIANNNKNIKETTLIINNLSYIKGYMKILKQNIEVLSLNITNDAYDEYEITTSEINSSFEDIYDDASYLYGIRPVIVIDYLGRDE